MIKNGFVV